MTTLRDSVTEVERELAGYRNTTPGGLAINAAGSATFKSAVPYVYLSDGVYKNKAAIVAQAFSTGHAVQPIGQTAYFTVGVDAAGTVTTYQGLTASAAAVAAALLSGLAATTVLGMISDVPNGVTPLGLIKVATTSAAFTPGTTALDAAGLTVTFFDVALLPSVSP